MNKHDEETILLAAEILDSDLQNPPTIAMLSRKLAINQQKLKRNFKQLHNITIRQYVLHKRLEKAKNMLIHKQGMSISAISEAIGYNNASYFARRFRGKYGLLPHQLRERAKTT